MYKMIIDRRTIIQHSLLYLIVLSVLIALATSICMTYNNVSVNIIGFWLVLVLICILAGCLVLFSIQTNEIESYFLVTANNKVYYVAVLDTKKYTNLNKKLLKQFKKQFSLDTGEKDIDIVFTRSITVYDYEAATYYDENRRQEFIFRCAEKFHNDYSLDFLNKFCFTVTKVWRLSTFLDIIHTCYPEFVKPDDEFKSDVYGILDIEIIAYWLATNWNELEKEDDLMKLHMIKELFKYHEDDTYANIFKIKKELNKIKEE